MDKVRVSREAYLLNQYTTKIFKIENQRNREERRKRKLSAQELKKKTECNPVYDSNGIHIESRLDLCDCMSLRCKGCFFMPCPNCDGNKCGPVCRERRSFIYEAIYQEKPEGQQLVIQNPLK